MKDGLITYSDGTKVWYQDGKRHQLDGPAIIHKNDGYKAWWYEGKLLEISQESISELLEVVVG